MREIASNCFLASKLKNFVFACILFLLSDLLPQQIACLLVMFQGVLNGLDLHGNCRQHCFLQAVKLIKAAPRSALHQAHKDPPHRLHIDALQSTHMPN